MIKHGRFFFPDHDTHFKEMLNENGYYQEDTFMAALQHCKERRTFIDIGAHVGMWSIKANDVGFRRIIGFEPVPSHIECFLANKDQIEAELYFYDCILGNGGYGKMENFIEGNTGALRSLYSDIPQKGYQLIEKLDEVLIGGLDIDLIKIDVEGFERQVLEGAKETLLRSKPVVVIEQKSNHEGIEYLKELGARLMGNVKRDYIFKWNESEK
jgi:FkbM family methyltransferase